MRKHPGSFYLLRWFMMVEMTSTETSIIHQGTPSSSSPGNHSVRDMPVDIILVICQYGWWVNRHHGDLRIHAGDDPSKPSGWILKPPGSTWLKNTPTEIVRHFWGPGMLCYMQWTGNRCKKAGLGRLSAQIGNSHFCALWLLKFCCLKNL